MTAKPLISLLLVAALSACATQPPATQQKPAPARQVEPGSASTGETVAVVLLGALVIGYALTTGIFKDAIDDITI